MLTKPTTLSTPLLNDTDRLSLFVNNCETLYSVSQIPISIHPQKFYGFVNKRYLIQRFCKNDNTWLTIYDSYQCNRDVVIWPICVVFRLLSLQSALIVKSAIVQSPFKVSLYFNLSSVLVLIVINDDTVQEVFELNKSINKDLSAQIDILAITDIDDKCHIICRDEIQNCLIYLTHNPDTKELIVLFRQTANYSMYDANHNLTSNRHGNLYHFQCTKSVFSSSMYQRHSNQWSNRNMIQINDINNIEMDTDFIWIKGDHFLIFKKDSICVLHLKSKSIINTLYLSNYTNMAPSGKYKAILESETDDKIRIKINGYTRRIIKASDRDIRYPPQYLIELMMSYYSYEKIYLFKVYASCNPCILWILNVDEIFNVMIS